MHAKRSLKLFLLELKIPMQSLKLKFIGRDLLKFNHFLYVAHFKGAYNGILTIPIKIESFQFLILEWYSQSIHLKCHLGF